MSTSLSDRVGASVRDLQQLQAVIAQLERERDYFRQLSCRLFEMVDRQKVNYAERTILESAESSLGADAAA